MSAWFRPNRDAVEGSHYRWFQAITSAGAIRLVRCSNRSLATSSCPKPPSGLPVFRHPDDAGEIAKLLKSVTQFPERAHLVGVYALGKAQRIICLLREAGYDKPLFVHGALAKLNALYEEHGIDLGPLQPATDDSKNKFAGEIILAPPDAIAERWSRRFADPLPVFASGWMRVRARARQRHVELPLIISDHADWDELTGTFWRNTSGRDLADAR